MESKNTLTIYKLKENIVNKILSNIPKGSNINILSNEPICFTISLSNLVKNKNFNSKMCNYKYLVNILKDNLLSTPLEDIENKIKQIIKHKYILVSNEKIIIPNDIINVLSNNLNKINITEIELKIKK